MNTKVLGWEHRSKGESKGSLDRKFVVKRAGDNSTEFPGRRPRRERHLQGAAACWLGSPG